MLATAQAKPPVDFDFGDDINGRPSKGLTAEEMVERASIVNGGETGYQEITCPKCRGRGVKTYGYVNITSYPCGMCKQTGKVTARRIASVEAAKKGRETAARNLQERIETFRREHADIHAFLARNSEWSDFYRELLGKLNEYGSLTNKQMAAVQRGIEKAVERKAQKQAEAANAPKVEVSAIEALFSVAAGNGLKRPVFRAMDGIEVSLAPAAGKNAGALYVKENGEYAGKIVGGQYLATRAASERVLPRLLAIAADPMGEATLFGKQTGVCGCCGRELTDPNSIAAGIGPICESKWGF